MFWKDPGITNIWLCVWVSRIVEAVTGRNGNRITGFLWKLSFLILEKPIADSRNFFFHNPARTFFLEMYLALCKGTFSMLGNESFLQKRYTGKSGEDSALGRAAVLLGWQMGFSWKIPVWEQVYTIEFSKIRKNSELGTGNIGTGTPWEKHIPGQILSLFNDIRLEAGKSPILGEV